jgi:hypothetical protein
MDIYRETQIRKDFDKGVSIDVTVVENGEEIENKVFNKDNGFIEEVVDFITYNENSGYDVFC